MVRIARLCCAAALCLGLQAQGSFDARIAALEKTMDRFYRGERLDDAVDRSNRGIEAYNAHAKALQAQTEKERVRLEQVMGEGKEERARLEDMDRELKSLPPGTDQDVMKRKVDARNALVHQINDQSAKARQALEEYNVLVRRIQEEGERERKHVLEVQDAVNARVAAYEPFVKAGEDAAFFTDLNRVLADVRQALRKGPGDSGLEGTLTKVRSLRRELAAWAAAGQTRQPNGLVMVEALVGDEPCWFVVDTGAMDTIVSEEIIDAIGLGASIGKQTSLSVVGGLRVTGLACRIPSLTVAGQVQKDVPASAVRPSDVGIDGLLGQSFLKAFVYTIDERSPEKLKLVRR